ncbi:hypothetical protein GCM10011584_18480 [Nocardioides phosphati]|uniref:ESX secretion-associated protein EspG n=1 Tax=Nocardioides phosphati TaxID=1867775 RepID=A0ABQ2N9C2_9ACTN|nr:hypothetical protein [Nocardioides phosphati]GGO89326.1 hypothetical protein GCM10011584_18480 [Nocardioides phosphati]
MTTHVKLTEEQWAAAARGAGASFSGPLAPLITGPSTTGEWTTTVAVLAAGDVTVDVLGSCGGQAWLGRVARRGVAHASAVRTLVPGPGDGSHVGVVPGLELGRGTTGMVESVLRLVPGLRGNDASPPVVALPTARVGAVFAALREGAGGGAGGARRTVLDQLGWSDVPDEIASLERVDGDLTLTVSAPGRRTRVVRLLHGRGGWVVVEAGVDGLRYRRATTGWLRAELAWELTRGPDVEAG